MSWIFLYFELKDYGVELSAFQKLMSFKEGISFFMFSMTFFGNKGHDHCPRFELFLEILNFKILEFTVFYKHDRETDSLDYQKLEDFVGSKLNEKMEEGNQTV